VGFGGEAAGTEGEDDGVGDLEGRKGGGGEELER
jgi:hypothetical protein